MKNFLQHLYQMSGGDIDADVSMYEVGEQLGLDRNEAGAVAEDLIIDGLAELKTLAGGITITNKGLEALGKSDGRGGANSASGEHVLGDDDVLDDDDRQAIERMVADIRQAAGKVKGYAELEEIVIDIKTMEVQLLSPRPKSAVIKSVLLSIGQQMLQLGDLQLSTRIDTLAGGTRR